MNQPAVLFPDTVELVVGAITDGFAARDLTCVVGNKVPVPAPGQPTAPEYLTVRRHGGPRRDLVTDQAQIGLESVAETEAAAHDNLQVARAIVNALRGTVRSGWSIGRVDEFAGPQDLPDPISTKPRYVQTFLVAVRGHALD